MNTKLLFAAIAAVTFAAGAQAASQANKQAMEANILNGTSPAPLAGGTCGVPTAFTASPYSDTGTTVGGTSIVSVIPSGCSNYTTVAGPDVVYSFTAGTAANLTFTVAATTATYDPAIYLLSSCADGTSCIIGADATLDGGTETFTASTLTAGTTYFLHIDSFYSSASVYGSGAYNLSVTGTLPVQLQNFEIN